MKVWKRMLFSMAVLVFSAILVFSGYQIGKISAGYENEQVIHDRLLEYKPVETTDTDEAAAKTIVNQSVLDLQSRYPDVAGWLTIPNTNVEYPFAWYRDNNYYLRRDLDGNALQAGTLFMDYRCKKDFSSPNTIIYGHHMKNGSMFGSLQSFNNEVFFENNRYGTIYLPNDTLTLTFFAYMVINPDTEQEVYDVSPSANYLNYVEKNARYYRKVELTGQDRIVTLSTCAYEFEDARMVLLAKAS